jgi:hypothetical protein
MHVKPKLSAAHIHSSNRRLIAQATQCCKGNGKMKKVIIALFASSMLVSIATADPTTNEILQFQKSTSEDYRSNSNPPVKPKDYELTSCYAEIVEQTLMRVFRLGNGFMITKVLNTQEIFGYDDTRESRWCRSEVLLSNRTMHEVIYQLTWVSKSEGRFWLKIQGGRPL